MAPSFYQEPEPIIEIIIKDANVSSQQPQVAPPSQPKKKKEPVQVFYVKYKKNPHGTGKDSIIYDTPIPALTPSVGTHDEHDEHELTVDKPYEHVVTLPPTTTTIRTIIRPESETFIGTKGIHVTFGGEKNKKVPGNYEESAPQPSVIFPQENFQQGNSRQAFQGNIPLRSFRGPQFRPGPPGPPGVFKNPPNQGFPVQRPTITQNLPSPQQRIPFNNQVPPFGQFNFNSQGPLRQPPPPSNTPRIPISQITFTQKPLTHFPISQNFQNRPIETQNSNLPLNLQQHALPSPQKPPMFDPSSSTLPQFPPLIQHQAVFNSASQSPPKNSAPQQNFGQKNQFFAQNPQFSGFSGDKNGPQNPTHFENIPLGGELVKSVPKFEQHLSVPVGQNGGPFNQNSQNGGHFSQNGQFSQNSHFSHNGPINQNSQIGFKNGENVHFGSQSSQNSILSSQNKFGQNGGTFSQNGGSFTQNGGHFNQNGGHFSQNTPQFSQNGIKNNQNDQFSSQNGVRSTQNGHFSQNQLQNSQIGGHFSQNSGQFSQNGQFNKPNGAGGSQNAQFSQNIVQNGVPSENSHFSQNLAQNGQTRPQTSPLVQDFPKNNQPFSFHFNEGIQSNTQVHQSSPQNFAHLLNQSPNLEQQFRGDKIVPQEKLAPQDYQKHLQNQFRNFQTTTQRVSTQDFHNFGGSSPRNIPPLFQTTSRSSFPNNNNVFVPTTQRIVPTTTTTTTTTTTEKPKAVSQTLPPNIELPDEVPEELRKQLLESGILANAQISILDYDKVGDIPIEALPPDQLANFYGAGGAQQIAASEQKLAVVNVKGELIATSGSRPKEVVIQNDAASDKSSELPANKKNVEMKVVHYDPNTIQGQDIPNAYLRQDAKQTEPVLVNDLNYNRYLPVKVNGDQFPIPDVPELKGKRVSSVVVLAPVADSESSKRTTRHVDNNQNSQVKFLSGQYLSRLIEQPNADNYRRWLRHENETASDKQSVVLLVTQSDSDPAEKEIFMYDISSGSVSKLSGELSSAFVEAAETNSEQSAIGSSDYGKKSTSNKKGNISNIQRINSNKKNNYKYQW